MIMKTIYFLSLIGIIVLVSCNNPRPSETSDIKTQKTIEPPYIIDLESNINREKVVPLSSIGKELEYIPLETTPNSIFKSINQIFFSETYIFISDFNKLLQFDRTGKFIRQVGSNGRGPGEYIHVTGFCIDQKNEKIYIAAWGIHSIQEFDFNGNFIRSFNQPFFSSQFLVKDTNRFVFRLNYNDKTTDSDFKLYITDTNAIPIVKIKDYIKHTREVTFTISVTPMYVFDNNFHFMQFCVDTLFTLKNDILEPYAIFNLGKLKMNPDVMIATQNLEEEATRFKQKLWIDKISENLQYLFLKLNYGFSDSSRSFIVNKLTMENTFLESNSLKNDIDGGIPFWPKYIYNDSILVDYYGANSFLNQFSKVDSKQQKVKYGDKYIQFEKQVVKLDRFSNPILIILN